MGVLVVVAGLCAVGCSSPTPSPTEGTEAHAELDVDSGATFIVVQAADIGDLYRVSVNPSSGEMPVVTRSGEKVHVALQQTGPSDGATTVEIDLSTRVVWILRLNGGTHTETIDMRNGHLSELDLMAGATVFNLLLGRPTGVVPVRFTGGATELDAHLQAGVAARLDVRVPISTLRIDGDNESLGSPPEVISVGDASAANRYEVLVDAGAAAVVVDHQ